MMLFREDEHNYLQGSLDVAYLHFREGARQPKKWTSQYFYQILILSSLKLNFIPLTPSH